jgi:hypothetical protein
VDEADVVAELFGGPRDEFLAIRSKRAAEAKAAGDPDLARRIGALRKPTVAAWLVNQLVRRYPEDADQLADVAGELGDAHRHGSGERLREAGQARRELLRRLEVRVRELAHDTGVRLSDDTATQIDTTFQAALINPAALRAVRSGQLSASVGLDSDVLDQWPVADVIRPPAPPRPKPQRQRPEPEPEAEPEPEPEPDPKLIAAWEKARELATAAAQAREQAERELGKAQEVAARTEEALADAKAKLDAARQDHQRARTAVETARTTLAGATRDEKAAARELAAHPDPRQRAG